MIKPQTDIKTLRLNKAFVFLLLLFLFIGMRALSSLESEKQIGQQQRPDQSSQTNVGISANAGTDINKSILIHAIELEK